MDKLYTAKGLYAEDDGSAWDWVPSGARYRAHQGRNLRVKPLQPARVLVIDSGPLMVETALGDLLCARFPREFNTRSVDDPADTYVQICPIAAVNAVGVTTNKEGRTRIPQPLKVKRPPERRAVYYLAENPNFVLLSPDFADELRNAEAAIKFDVVRILDD